MKKKSIKDFFSPVPQNKKDGQKGVPPLQDASLSQSSSTILSTSDTHRSLPSAHVPIASSLTAPNSGLKLPCSPPTAIDTDAQSPDASQPTTKPGASKRIVSNGQPVVLDSDSDSDSIENLQFDFKLPTTANKTQSPAACPSETIKSSEIALRRAQKRTGGKKRHFDQVAEEVQKNREFERLIKEHKAHLDAEVEPSVSTFAFNEDTLVQAIDSNEDAEKKGRLLLAMQRTNAVSIDSVFHFFDANSASARPRPFPFNALPESRWKSCFRAPCREQAFLSGLAYQVSQLHRLPDVLIEWMVHQMCWTSSDALDLNYLQILQSETHGNRLQTFLTPSKLDDLFEAIGGNVGGLRQSDEVQPSIDGSIAYAVALPRSLKSIALLLEGTAPLLQSEARSRAIYLLCHVCMDQRALTDPNILEKVQNAIESLFRHYADPQTLAHGLQDILPLLLSRIANPVLQRHLVRALPTKSPSTAYFQRYLAMSFLVHPDKVEVPLEDPQSMTRLQEHLSTSPNFRVTKETNYSFLQARITLLDISIGPGLASVPYQPPATVAVLEEDMAPMMAPTPATFEVKAFNNAIDSLAQQIKLLSNSIIETGALVNVTIFETKDTVERLCSRLESAVRIGGRKYHNVFDKDGDEKQLKIKDIFRKAAQARPATQDDHDVDDAIEAQIRTESAL